MIIKFKKLLTNSGNLIDKYKFFIFAIFILGLVSDILINPRVSDSLVLALIVFWIINIFNLKLSPVYSLILATLTYLVSFVTQFFGQEMIVEKGASWFFVFLGVALVQKTIQEFSQSEKKV